MKSGRGVLAVLLCGTWIAGTNGRVGAQAVPAAPAKASCGADLAKTLAGSWKAPLRVTVPFSLMLSALRLTKSCAVKR